MLLGAEDKKRIKKIKKIIKEIYAEHNPSKLEDVDRLMCKYRSKELELLEAIRDKYAG